MALKTYEISEKWLVTKVVEKNVITLRWEISSSYDNQVHCTMWNNKIKLSQIFCTSIDDIYLN